MLSYSNALSMSDPVHLVVTKTNSQGESSLIGTCNMEWRRVLASNTGRLSLTVELNGVGSECKITSGILELQLEIIPRCCEVLERDVLETQLSMERQRGAERERLFLVYAKQWWKEYLQIRSSHAQRLVKIFARDEAGLSKPVCAYVQLLRAGRMLDGPRHAARFVSLIPFERASSVGHGGCCTEVWSSLHTMLCQRKGVSLLCPPVS